MCGVSKRRKSVGVFRGVEKTSPAAVGEMVFQMQPHMQRRDREDIVLQRGGGRGEERGKKRGREGEEKRQKTATEDHQGLVPVSVDA